MLCLEAMFACLQYRFNQLSIVIRHCLVKSILHSIPFEASMLQVLLHCCKKSLQSKKEIIFCQRGKGPKEMISFFSGVSVGAFVASQKVPVGRQE